MPISTQLAAMAARGWHLFPLYAGGRKPLVWWGEAATSDVAQLERWAAKWPGCNWGIATGPSDLLVIDVDVKHGAPGQQSWDALLGEHPELANTLTVRTPTGGLHAYFSGTAPTTGPKSRAKLGEGIDTRGIGGFVVAPGSTTDQGSYTVERRSAPAPIPAWVRTHLGRVFEREEQTPAVDYDSEVAVRRCREWLRTSAPLAIEGRGGDDTTFRVAAQCRQFGVSEAVAADLMTSEWNDRCSPPWDLLELAKKVGNAYTYAKAQPGSCSPEAAFSPVSTPEPEPAPPAADIQASPASEIDAFRIPKREWLLGHRLIKSYVTVTVAPGGVGKSTLATLEALALATGRDLTGDPVIERGPVWIYNTEDPLDEIQRRVAAAAIHHGIDLKDLSNVHISSGRDAPLILVSEGPGGPEVNRAAMESMARYILQHRIKLLVLDPFVRCHRVNENDNMAIDLVVQALTWIAGQTRCAINVVHHTSKRMSGDEGHGDMNMARGASALVSAARIAHTMGPMTKAEAEELGIPEDDRVWYARLDDAKGNMAPPTARARWFRRVSLKLPNGDGVGVIEPAAISPPSPEEIDQQVLDQIFNTADLLNLSGSGVSLSAFAAEVFREQGLKMRIPTKPAQQAKIRALLPAQAEGFEVLVRSWTKAGQQRYTVERRPLE